ncbi:hypothetical protein A2U01_0100730, partial [Trifolium medium]|nr:hypothetical protein [Trifolium medium]
SASAPMTRKEMITALEANCKELDEKKLQFERMIHALRLEEVAVEAIHTVKVVRIKFLPQLVLPR